MPMTPRERILCALDHREPDRVPIDLGGTESSSITGIAYNRLKRYLGIEGGRTQIFDLVSQIAKIEQPIVEKVGSDVVPLLIEPKMWKPWALPDGSPCEIPLKVEIKKLDNGDEVTLSENGTPVLKRPKGGYYFDSIFHPLEEAEDEKDIDRGVSFFRSMDLPWYNDEGFDGLKTKARRLYGETSRAVIGNLWVHLLAAGQDLRGYENFMVDLVINKPLAHRLLERQLEAYLPRIDRYIDAVGGYVDIIEVNDDLGSQNGPIMRPELYREMIKPYHKKLWEYIKKKSKKPLLLHSCGSVYKLIPELIECGIDALNPVQVTAADMDTARLKSEFGKELVFWGGGCDTQKVLPHGTVQEVREEVRRRIDDLAFGGGFVFCQVHNIQPDVPPENIVAMYEEIRTLL
jgi:uroporphyrinogen decarboxylase